MSGGNVKIGKEVVIGPGCFFEARHTASIRIDERVSIGPYCILITTTHENGTPVRRAGQLISDDITIGVGTWLGTRVTVLPGTNIGAGCIVGANSLLRGEYPPNTLIVSPPARAVSTIEER